MRAAAQHFLGVHDFRNFCKIDRNKPEVNFVRNVQSIDILPVGAEYAIGLRARGR
jgi:tRNA pseudouridine38/39 synthase